LLRHPLSGVCVNKSLFLPKRHRAIGNAPIMKNNIFKISSNHKFQTVILFLKRELNLKSQDSIYLYINSAFSPSPDEILKNLYQCFHINQQLIINYCMTPAWG
jgi:ubiquitin-like protein ATG12